MLLVRIKIRYRRKIYKCIRNINMRLMFYNKGKLNMLIVIEV